MDIYFPNIKARPIVFESAQLQAQLTLQPQQIIFEKVKPDIVKQILESPKELYENATFTLNEDEPETTNQSYGEETSQEQVDFSSWDDNFIKITSSISECLICSKSVQFPDGAESHFRTMHDKNFKYLCHVCGIYCSDTSIFFSHLKSKHKFRIKCCSICPEPNPIYSHRIELCNHFTTYEHQRHAKKYMKKEIEKKRPMLLHACSLCHDKFFTRQGLTRHCQGHYSLLKTAVGPRVRCESCRSMFSTFEKYVVHFKQRHKLQRKEIQEMGFLNKNSE